VGKLQFCKWKNRRGNGRYFLRGKWIKLKVLARKILIKKKEERKKKKVIRIKKTHAMSLFHIKSAEKNTIFAIKTLKRGLFEPKSREKHAIKDE
jgi:hypothetical protein